MYSLHKIMTLKSEPDFKASAAVATQDVNMDCDYSKQLLKLKKTLVGHQFLLSTILCYRFVCGIDSFSPRAL
jgi:hypothetical protein